MGTRQFVSPLDRYEAQRICLVKPSALGDVIQTLPILTALRQRYPCAHLAWIVNRRYSELLEGHPDLDEIIPFDRWAGGGGRWSSLIDLAIRLRSARFDLVCDLQGLLRSGLMAAWTGARRRVGLSTAREGARFFYTDLVPVPTLDMPSVERYWLLVEALGAGHQPKQFRVPLYEQYQRWARQQLAGLPRPLVALNPGARWVTKRWPAGHFTHLAARLQNEHGTGVVLVGGPEDTGLAEDILRNLKGPAVNLAGRTGLKELAAVLAEVDLVVSGDSGPMHLAAAVGTPVVALFTCTSPVRAGPYGSGHSIVATGVYCAASYLKRCDRLDCMRDLSPDRVWPAVKHQLERWQQKRQRLETLSPHAHLLGQSFSSKAPPSSAGRL